MTISANTVWEVRTGGSDNNGGGFVTGASGTDRSQQDAAHATLTALSLVHTTTSQINVSLVDYTVTAADIGNILQITGGTATAGLFQITAADTVNNRWTVDRSAGTAAQTVVGAMGGAFASPGKAAAATTVDGNLIWVKAGTYTITTATPGAAGPVLLTSNIRTKMEGYSSTRGDRAGRPELNAGAVTTVNLFAHGTADTMAFVHMKTNGNSQSAVSGFVITSPRVYVFDCLAVNCDQANAEGFDIATDGAAIVACGASACTIGFNNSAGDGSFHRCWADACGTGFSLNGLCWAVECVASDCTGDGFNVPNSSGGGFIGCTADGNGGDGFDLGSFARLVAWCAATNNTGVGFANASLSFLDYCASYNNSARSSGSPLVDSNPITLTGDPWTNAAGDDYSPNNTAGAGASLRNIAGDVYGQTDNRDIGAVQHADPAGGSVAAKPLGGFIG